MIEKHILGIFLTNHNCLI